MQIRVEPFTVHKRVPLTISRGTTAETTNLWLVLEHDGIEGWGEASPFSVRGVPQTTEAIAQSLSAIAPQLQSFTPFNRQKIEELCAQAKLPSAACTAIDLALHDWLGKAFGVPLWKLWGLDLSRIGPTSVTIGINTPEAAQHRLVQWLEVTTVKAVKIKLGSPTGLEADQLMFEAVMEKVPSGTKVSVDANGGWSLEGAIAMSQWLADRGVTYLEQPLPQGQEADLLPLYERSPLPLFADESCFDRRDIPGLSDRVHGINIKLMKSGGLSEALRMIHTAQTYGLQLMFGCYSDSALSNTAASHLAPFATHLDLDSHLNLIDDPFVGATMVDGYLKPNDLPGLGVTCA
ncbi:dipeptide epimerase [Leptolyngbya sp. AN02str]|uniref:dipeptide epimerase n=1 Tax=Leptolyngbya sp. AN02str TaxID=3423363 RepID=UPI003D30F14D